MSRQIVMTVENISKLLGCFADQDDLHEFVFLLQELAEEIDLNAKLRRRSQGIEEDTCLFIKEVALFTIFCREHIELIRELVSSCQYHEVSKEKKRDDGDLELF